MLAAQPDEVARDLVPKILDVSGNGAKVEFLTTDRILSAFFRRFIKGAKSELTNPNPIPKPDPRTLTLTRTRARARTLTPEP